MSKKNNISKDTIYSFSEQQDNLMIAEVFFAIKNIINNAIENVSRKNLAIVSPDKVDVSMIGSNCFGVGLTNSELQLMVSINSPQLELSSFKLVKSWKELFKDRLYYAWFSTKSKRKQKKIIRKRVEKKTSSEAALAIKNENYNINDFKNDVFAEILQFLPPTCVIYNNDDSIYISSKADLGANFKLFFSLEKGNGDKSYSLFDYKENAMVKYDYEKVTKVIKNRIDKFGNNYIKLYRILNNLYYALYKTNPDFAMLECFMARLNSDCMFKFCDINKTFVLFINYINLVSPYKVITQSDLTNYIDNEHVTKKYANLIKDFLTKLLTSINYKI